jgi:hypothetical protein
MPRKKERYTFQGYGLNKKQKKIGRKKCKEYRKYYTIENYAQFELLEELIFRELMQMEQKKRIEEIANSENVEARNLVTNKQWKALDENLEKMIELKERLGMLSKDENNDFYSKMSSLQKKYKKWVMNHKADYTFKCPNCEQWIMAYIDLRKYGKTKHPHFRGNIIYNKKLWELWEENQITQKDIAEILNVSSDYIPYIKKELFGKKKKKK